MGFMLAAQYADLPLVSFLAAEIKKGCIRTLPLLNQISAWLLDNTFVSNIALSRAGCALLGTARPT